LWPLLATMSSRSSVLEAVWNGAQPKLTEIRALLSKGKREDPRIIRVGQLDSELLDQELAQLLKEPINKALSLISVCFVPPT
jgi:peroxin-2